MGGLSDILTRVHRTAWAMAALGLVLIDQQQPTSAIQILQESLELHRQTMGEGHRKTLSCTYRVAWLCHKLGEFRRSEYVRFLSRMYRAFNWI